jgi:hypothetical protein
MFTNSGSGHNREGEMDWGIEEGRAASKSPHSTFGYFLSISQQEVQNSAVGNFSPKQKEQRQKQPDVSFL